MNPPNAKAMVQPVWQRAGYHLLSFLVFVAALLASNALLTSTANKWIVDRGPAGDSNYTLPIRTEAGVAEVVESGKDLDLDGNIDVWEVALKGHDGTEIRFGGDWRAYTPDLPNPGIPRYVNIDTTFYHVRYQEAVQNSDDAVPSRVVEIADSRTPYQGHAYVDYNGDGIVDRVAQGIASAHSAMWIIHDEKWRAVEQRNEDEFQRIADGTILRFGPDGWTPVE